MSGSIYLLAFCFCVLINQISTFTDCGSTIGHLINVRVKDCNKVPCILKRGENATIEIDFIPVQNIDDVVAHVSGHMLGISVNFPLPHPDACQYSASGITCPLKKNTSYFYKATLPVKKMYPKLHVIVEWKLVNEKNLNIICTKIPVQIE